MKADSVFTVDGRAAIVTGASSGLGDRFARVLAANGARVLAVARRTERLEALAAEAPGVIPFAADVTDDDARAAIVEAALDAFGAVDILVNNAGVGSALPAIKEPIEAFEATIGINLTATFDLARRCAVPMIAAERGSIVNIASIAGLVAGTPLCSASYSASKGAVVNLTRQLGVEWARKGVRVNAVAPGWFPSEMSDQLPPPARERALEDSAMHRFGEPEELDGILLFLASDASSYCTGQVFVIDGGGTAR
jgi:NAD(P)-dependent dehydrogenase (short-subunit alcohol dehydrogenase family)